MNTLSSALNKIWMRIDRQQKTAFFSAMIVGLLAHITFMTNRFFNHDSILYTLVDPQSTFALQQGKWFSQAMQRLVQGDITTPGIIIPVALVLLGLTSALTVASLKIKSPLWAAGIGAFLVLFPSVMCANIYDASAIFFSALALSALAVYVSVRWKFGFLGGIALLTISCGVYSVFIGYAAGLFILILLFGLISGEMTIKVTIIKGLKFLGVLIASAGLFYLILNLLLRVSGVSLMEYRGIDHIGRFSISSLGTLIFEAYRKVYYFFYYGLVLYRSHFEIEPMFRIMNWASIILLVGLCSWIAIRCRVFRSIGKLALILVLTLLFPLAIHLIAVLGQNSATHWIMCYPFVLVYVAMLAGADRAETVFFARLSSKAPKKNGQVYLRVATCVALVISLLLCRQWYFTTNQAYEYIRYQNENAFAKGTMLTNDIQNTPQYMTGVPVALIGSSAPVVFQYNTGDFLVIHGSSGIGYTGYNSAMIDNERLKVLLRNWIGIEFQYVDADTVSKLSQNASVIAMPVYPEQGSIAFVDGVLVVKLSDIQISPAE